MEEIFEIERFDLYKEDNRREVKKAKGGLPLSIWETYSAFANTYGGVIILGISEREDKSWKTTGLKNECKEKLLDEFWSLIQNEKKVSINLLFDSDVKTYEVRGDLIIVINVPKARREYKPVFINSDLFNGTFRRSQSGDYHCTRLQIKSMLRDQTENTIDMEVLEEAKMKELNKDTIRKYRNRHSILKTGHPFEILNDLDYLRSIGAAANSEVDSKLHPTAAGMLMFGNEFSIVRYSPEYFLDYREEIDTTIRWTGRLCSNSGERAGSGVPNIYYI